LPSPRVGAGRPRRKLQALLVRAADLGHRNAAGVGRVCRDVDRSVGIAPLPGSRVGGADANEIAGTGWIGAPEGPPAAEAQGVVRRLAVERLQDQVSVISRDRA